MSGTGGNKTMTGSSPAESSPETVESLFDVFLPCLIRNKELDNIDLSGTRWTITDKDANTITLDNDIPYLHGLNNNTNIFDTWGLYKDYFNLVQIDSVNYDTKVITYSAGAGTVAIGNEITFFNPFRKGRMVNTSPLLDTNSWATAYVQPAGVWEHSDGSYKMLVNGNDGSKHQIGMATSNDLETWLWVGDAPLFTSGTAPFNKSWMDTGGIFSVSNPVKIPDSTDRYYLCLTVMNTGGLWETVIVVADEDMNVIKVAENPIAIPGYANTHGNQAGGLIYHNGVFKLFVINRRAALVNWEIFEMEMGDPLNGDVGTPVTVAQGTGTNIWYGNHVDAVGLLIYKEKLYCFVAGTGIASTEIWSGNREYGLFSKEGGVWTNYKLNPVLCSPIEGENIWGAELLWATDHIGGYFGNYVKDNYLYIFISMNNGSNTYKVAGMKFDLRKI